jgi:hypothetical protein
LKTPFPESRERNQRRGGFFNATMNRPQRFSLTNADSVDQVITEIKRRL